MRKAHWWEHISITNKTFDCLICDQGQGRAKRVFTLRFNSQVHLSSSVMKKRRILLRISPKSAHLYDDERGGRGSIWAISISVPLKGLRLVQPGTGPQRHQRCRIFISPSYTHSTSICFLLFSFYVMTSLATTVHIRKQLYHIESPMAKSWHIHSACNFGMVHLTFVKYTDILQQ